MVIQETREANRTAKFVVGGLGGLLGVLAALGLAVLAFSMLLLHSQNEGTGGLGGLLGIAGGAIGWTAVAGVGTIIVALAAKQRRTVWIAGISMFLLGVVPSAIVLVATLSSASR